jgi:hypothetical protein
LAFKYLDFKRTWRNVSCTLKFDIYIFSLLYPLFSVPIKLCDTFCMSIVCNHWLITIVHSSSPLVNLFENLCINENFMSLFHWSSHKILRQWYILWSVQFRQYENFWVLLWKLLNIVQISYGTNRNLKFSYKLTNGCYGETSLNNHRFTHNVVWHIFEFLSSSPVFWWIRVADLFSFLCCPIMCLSSVLWCPLRFPHINNVRFIFTSSCL